MERNEIGAIIYKKRMALGITQESLAEGICAPITISRVERGKQRIAIQRMRAILERLDLPIDRYGTLATPEELEIEELYDKIVDLNVRFAHAGVDQQTKLRQEAYAAMDQLRSIMRQNDTISQQLLLRSQAILGNEAGASPLDVQEQLLLCAIRKTCPRFELDQIQRGLYSTFDLKVLNQLALVYSDMGDHTKALKLFRETYDYIESHFREILPSRSRLILVGVNYTRELLLTGAYSDCLFMARRVKQQCITYNSYYVLPRLISFMAEAAHFMGDDVWSRELYIESIYLLKAFEDFKNLEIIRKDAEKYLGLDFPDHPRSSVYPSPVCGSSGGCVSSVDGAVGSSSTGGS